MKTRNEIIDRCFDLQKELQRYGTNYHTCAIVTELKTLEWLLEEPHIVDCAMTNTLDRLFVRTDTKKGES